ncbi:hypothetical protein OH809_43410 [Streptomyces sp. NBC_00873]|uniref:hypothetical protein n=1 Tax=unclassified Streptomyces TaxID=2593676 RepID=UPI0038659F44|nr:hypothetical protein OH809_00300 [Streptomyces sp. NBC_00873]WSY97458.1 hypothetical protein OH809_43410 [Streptomyces sp. NBC_00873]WTA49084.1 hypothetical protein OH821_00300 [Streptomyces sp. NBC_00842]WTA49128.1 hypothetical protein OH821_43515 [Streptomyces sp. NBC_00842]
MPARDEITVPAQQRVRPHQQSHPAQHLSRQALEQRGQERPVTRVEPDPLPVQLPLQSRTDLWHDVRKVAGPEATAESIAERLPVLGYTTSSQRLKELPQLFIAV